MSEAELVQRLERLERAHRRLKGFAVAALVLVTALATIYAAQPAPQKISAHQFDVVDDSGNVRVIIDASQNMPMISFYGINAGQGKVRAIMGIDESGSADIALADATGQTRSVLRVAPEGEPHFVLDNEKGSTSLSVDPSGSPNLTLSDARGFELDLGSTATVGITTGATKKTSAASIIMFGNDDKQHVIWQAP